jgi:hypothetical protein
MPQQLPDPSGSHEQPDNERLVRAGQPHVNVAPGVRLRREVYELMEQKQAQILAQRKSKRR